MKYDHILIRYGEMTLKSRNRKIFIDALRKRLNRALEGMDVHIKTTRDRAYIVLGDEDAYAVIGKLKLISGILSVSPVVRIEKTEAAMKETALEFTADFDADRTFKIEVKRADKTFPMETHDIQGMIGAHVLGNTDDLTVNVRQPDYKITAEIRREAVYMYYDTIKCLGGLPLGTGGKGLLMLSGGIDSPVAGLDVMKKGVEIEAVHFHSPPYTSPEATEKVKKLIDIMTERTGYDIKLHIVPFTELQTTLYDRIPDNLSMTSTRRVMLKIAERLAGTTGAEAVINGENLGQVASQTLTSMYAINEVTTLPVLRPLLTLEKNDIVNMAKQFGTYETSILPYEDCCTIFKPKSPKTKPSLEKVRKFEERVDFEPLIEKALAGIETYIPNGQDEDEAFEDLL
ncbi:tRNA uracil 4-sulfurtransferase ThiI [Lacicoccus alkaliphilus]|uniref:Probable tRNA sulfurtransferase n=1 Tax=Lacicoccus alkaliphilus DSM 16010 TaxID=1123231 RepID=A0A1M7AKM3_9BACL|nr:tRNA uracil 4-sulfurtransferase ThiI [Salinicoccus alkaliphilus]SHL43331.1 thiamine biosynthesis protein ThiI [Salinicoccus alkaliphilus DSM 16010]